MRLCFRGIGYACLVCVIMACGSNHPDTLGGAGPAAPEAGGTGGTDSTGTAGGQTGGGLNEPDGSAGSAGSADEASVVLPDSGMAMGTGGSGGAGGTGGTGGAGGTGGVGGVGGTGGTGGVVVDGGMAVKDAGPDVALPTSTSSQRQVARPLGETASGTGYLEYLPPGYGDGVKRPLLVVVPGITENGNGTTDLNKLTVRGPAKLIAENRWPDDRPFVVLSMQHLADSECASGAEVFAFFNYAFARYQIDLQHVYLTGISCGAISSWNYIGAYHATQIAAAVLIAGNGKPAWDTAGCSLGAVAIWAFHAEGDLTIPITGSTYPIDQLATCMPPGRPAKKTIYAGMEHDSWTQTYDLSAGNDIYTWMLSQSR